MRLGTTDPDTSPASASVTDWRVGIVDRTDEVPDSPYAMFSALCKASPTLHEIPWQGIYRDYDITIRGGIEVVSAIKTLQNKMICVGVGGVLLGEISPAPLTPRPVLKASHVVLCDRAYSSYASWLIAWGMSLQRRLDDLGVSCGVVAEKGGGLTISRHHLKTFTVTLSGLSDEDSIKAQTAGIGSKKKLGCGVFT